MPLRDILLALLVILIWGGNIVAIKMGVMELPPMVVITLRFAVTGLIFLPFMRWPGRAKFWKLCEIALYMSVLHQGLLFIAMDMLPASSMSILLQSQILFATLLGFFMLGEKIGWRTATGLAIGFAGLLLTLGTPDIAQSPQGFIITMCSAIALAFSYIRMRQIRDVHAPTFLGIMNLAAIPFVAAASFIPHPAGGWEKITGADWVVVGGVLAYQAALVSLSHSLWQSLLARNEVAKVTCFILLMPVVAIILSAIILNEAIHPVLILGGAMTLLGVGIVTLRKARKQQPVEADPVT